MDGEQVRSLQGSEEPQKLVRLQFRPPTTPLRVVVSSLAYPLPTVYSMEETTPNTYNYTYQQVDKRLEETYLPHCELCDGRLWPTSGRKWQCRSCGYIITCCET